MNALKKRIGVALVLVLGGLFAAIPSAWATQDFSFTGTFNQDDDVQLFNFTVGASSTVTLRSWGYAGGTNAAGQAIPEGGFDTILALFDSTGAFINSNDDGGCGLVAADSATGNCWDTYFSQVLNPGDYTVSVMEFDNFANGPNLSDGFGRDGDGNFTGTDCGFPGGSFLDTGFRICDQRTNAWAFDILGVDSAVLPPPTGVPEPSGLALMGGGLLLLFWLGRRRWHHA